jgi:F-type H+-transporting ATPase subunit epsilon
MATLRLEIVTPTAKTYSEDVEMVTITGVEGELGILPQHAPTMTMLKPGELRIKRGGQETVLATGGGFAEITLDRVSILTDMAISEADVDEEVAQAAMDRAKAALQNRDLGDEETAMAEAAIARSMAQLHLKRRRRSI